MYIFVNTFRNKLDFLWHWARERMYMAFAYITQGEVLRKERTAAGYYVTL